MKQVISVLSFGLFFFFSLSILAQEDKSKTIFHFGGYVKTDLLHTWYRNGDVAPNSPLRDFHLPSHIPVGDPASNFDLDYHVKESRFNFDAATTVLGKQLHGFVEMDFMLSQGGNERVTNSFNPRLRHFYFEWDQLLIGQTWSTFMIVTLPDEIDFTGALEGLVFIRQPQVRFTAGNWQFAIENPETTVTPYQTSQVVVTESEIFPDVVVRKNFQSNQLNWSIAGIMRMLHQKDSLKRSALGYGVTLGGKLKTGKKSNDLRGVITYGQGLGRYVGANFIAGGSLADETYDINPMGSLNGYIAYNHYWLPDKVSSSFSASAFQAFEDQNVSPESNRMAYSLSGNLKYEPIPALRFGVEYTYAYRELRNGVDGSFHRVQLAARYRFGYTDHSVNEQQ